MQSIEVLTPVKALAVLAGHNVHSVEPVDEEYDPGGQREQDAWLGAEENLPGGHGIQDEDDIK